MCSSIINGDCVTAYSLDRLLASYLLLINCREGKENVLDGTHFRDLFYMLCRRAKIKW